MVSKRSPGGWVIAACVAAACHSAGAPVFAATAPASPIPSGGPVIVSGNSTTPTLLAPRPAQPEPSRVNAPGPSLHAPRANATARPRVVFGGQLRLRRESRGVLDYRLPGTFGRPAAQSARAGGDVSLVRTRLGADLHLAPRVFGSLGLEDARSLDVAGSQGGASAAAGLEHAWVEFDSLAARALFVRLGRQSLACGEQRVLGGSDWSNRDRAYDGARARWAPGYAAAEGFVAQVHDAGAGGPRPLLSGIDVQWRSARALEVEGYGLERTCASPAAINEAGNAGGLFDATTGLRMRARLGAWELRTEGAVQRGRRAGDAVGAWFGVARVTAFLSSAWRTRFALEHTIASGDRLPGDGATQRFEPLEPPGQGVRDAFSIVGLSNVVDWSGAITAQTAPAWTVQAELHQVSLASATDAWFDADGNAIRRDPSGRSGTGIGRELNVSVTWNAGARASVMAVASRFSAGPFVQATGGGGSGSGAWLQLALAY